MLLNPLTRRRLGRRLLLSLASLLLTLALLELAARALVPVKLVRLRDGVFDSTLPLVNGRPTGPLQVGQGDLLPVAKAEGEVRVFLFGESSMEGCPWGHPGSPATMLYDRLAAAMPQARLTVVNMGRSSSFTLDSYYYLLGIARFAPDVVVFYQGTNDHYYTDPEMCAPALHPHLHRAWRWMVERSRLLWATRVFGPQVFKARFDATPQGQSTGGDLCPATTFRYWADLLVATARGLGAQVVVAAPVLSQLARIERGVAYSSRGLKPREALDALPGAYRDLLACATDPQCDFADRYQAAFRTRTPARYDHEPWDEEPVDARREAWREACERHDGVFVPFDRALASYQPGGVMGPPLIVDEVHLSLEGYGLLAAMLEPAVLAALQGRAPQADLVPALPEVERYRRDIQVKGLSETDCRVGLARLEIERRHFLIAATLLRGPASAGRRDARLGLGWLRLGLGLPSGLTPDLEQQARALGYTGLPRGPRFVPAFPGATAAPPPPD